MEKKGRGTVREIGFTGIRRLIMYDLPTGGEIEDEEEEPDFL